MPKNEELVVVYTTHGALRAEIKGKLASAGIPAIIRAESQNVIPMTVDGIGKAEVLVSKEREQEAREVLREK